MVDLDRLEDDLLDTLVWCEHRYPATRPLTLFAATQRTPVPGQLAVAIADTLRPVRTKLDGPIVEEARRCLQALGYSFEWHTGGDIDAFVEARSGSHSAHERLAVIVRFRELGL
jgi:hypothetical protein